MNPITVSTVVQAPLETTWQAFTDPEHVVHWNFAHESWHCPEAVSNLRVGGTFSYRMAARDGSFGFDFSGTYTQLEPHKGFAYTLGDERKVQVDFEPLSNGQTRVTETFDPETTNPEEMQRSGWQAILDNFKRHAEATAH